MFCQADLIYVVCLRNYRRGESEKRERRGKKEENGETVKGREGNDKQGYARETRCLCPKVQEQTNKDKLRSSCLLHANVGMT